MTEIDAINLKTETDTGTTVPINYEWKRRTDGPPWEVVDWQGKLHTFDSEQDGKDFIDREKRMLANATRAANDDVTDQITRAFQNGLGVESTCEQAAGPGPQGGESTEDVGSQGNRRSRRRARRASNSKKASGRRH